MVAVQCMKYPHRLMLPCMIQALTLQIQVGDFICGPVAPVYYENVGKLPVFNDVFRPRGGHKIAGSSSVCIFPSSGT